MAEARRAERANQSFDEGLVCMSERFAGIVSNPQTRSNSVRAVLLIIIVTAVMRFAMVGEIE